MAESADERPSLQAHEWLAVVVIIGFMGMLTVLSLSSRHASYSTGEPHHVVSPDIMVIIEGAVEKTGSFTIPKGTTLREVLDLAKPFPEAHLEKLNLNKPVRKNQVIKVPEKPFITITLEGAVNDPKTIKMPKGSRLEDLLGKLSFHAEADQEKLRRKRRLKNGETVKVPFKKND